ncbi:hypothetical protein QQS21_009651 [Conoideocrella luteorostrata]|uniref:AMP-dependent synthetase/ligase domain-containing protein n=1 Tax=Conoideocrella luteorostrata TaxID=1105319 RepID=A0AAJ0CHG8_9HYPO|nr:hypothetical protein QQS21_009651 [Conoideocrella luteorostrata]
MIFGSDASGSLSCSSPPSRGCNTPDSDVSDRFEDSLSNTQHFLMCHIPITGKKLPTTAKDNFVEVDLEDLSEVNDSFLQECGISPPTLLQVAWLLLLQSYTGKQFVACDILGPDYSNGLLCLQYKLRPDEKIIDLLHNIQLYKDASAKPNLSIESICNTAIVSREINSHIQYTSLSAYEILLELRPFPNSPSAALRYRRSTISAVQAYRIGETYRTILKSILDLPAQNVSSIERLSSTDRKQIAEWNQRTFPVLKQKLHEAFSEKALDNPEAPAVTAWDGDLTYEELDAASSVLAQHIKTLAKQHQNKTSLVPFCFDKSKFAIITMLAILKSGSVCLPLSSVEQYRDALDLLPSIEGEVICVSESYANTFAGVSRQLLIVNSPLLYQLQRDGDYGKISDVGSDNAFIQIVSSGPGQRKAVMQSHSALYTGTLAQGLALQYYEHSRVLQNALYTDFVSTGEIFSSLLFNACLVIVPGQEYDDGLAAMINEKQVTHAFLPASVADCLRSKELTSLKSLILMQDPMSLCEIDDGGFNCEVLKAYGNPETSVLCTMSRDATTQNSVFRASIGASFAASVWVVNPTDGDELLPVGAVGELVIGGPTIADGYVKDDVEVTRFVVNPAWASDQMKAKCEKLFCTGMLVKYLDNGDGELAFCREMDSIGVITGRERFHRGREARGKPAFGGHF